MADHPWEVRWFIDVATSTDDRWADDAVVITCGFCPGVYAVKGDQSAWAQVHRQTCRQPKEKAGA